MYLALNNLQRLICHKNQPTNQPTDLTRGWKSEDESGLSRLKHFKIGKNTQISPVDLKRLAVTQTPVKYWQLTLV